MIDTEHSSGDVNKMLLGSFVEEYDKDEGDDSDPFVDFPGPRYSPSENATSPQTQFVNGSSKIDV